MIKYILTTILSLACIYCMGQDPVTVGKKFEDIAENEEIGTITDSDLENGFDLQFLGTSGITGVKFRSLDGSSFDVALLGTRQAIAENGFRHNGLKPKPDANGIIEVQILKGEAAKTVRIRVNKTKPDGDCPDFVVTAKGDCIKPDSSNNFGLKYATDLEDDEIVYVYDFNPVTAKRRFYKISHERKGLFGKKEYKIRKVNFSKETLKPSKQVYIRLVNVNLFVNSISINDSLVDYFSEPSPLLNRLFFPDTSAQGSLLRRSGIAPQNSSAIEAAKSLECFQKMYTQMEAEILKAYDPCAQFNCCNNIDFATIKLQLNQVNSDINKVKFMAIAKQTELEKFKKEKEDCERKAAGIKKLNEEIKKLNERIAELKKTKKASSEEKQELATKETALKKAKADLADIKACTDEEVRALPGNITDAEDFLKNTALLTEIQKGLPTKENLNQLSVLLANIVEQNQNFTKFPIQLRGNRLDFSVEIQSVDSVVKRFGYPSYRDSAHYKIPILWTPFVSFSAGSFITFGKHLQNKTYTWQAATGANNTIDSSKFTLVESGYTLSPSGFAALANLEIKISRSFGFGVSAGVGLTLEDNPRPAYLAGGSLFLGDIRQFALTFGFAGMQIERLSNNFQTMADNQVISAGRPSIETYKELRVGGFLSLTYTPFVTKRNK